MVRTLPLAPVEGGSLLATGITIVNPSRRLLIHRGLGKANHCPKAVRLAGVCLNQSLSDSRAGVLLHLQRELFT